MAEEEKTTTQSADEGAGVNNAVPQEQPANPATQGDTPIQQEQGDASADEGKKGDKSKKSDKKEKSGKKDGKNNASDSREKAKLQKEWEDSIVASKRVKREEIRRKFKQAVVILLVFALIVTSVVYVMLLFVQENNVRITAKSKQDKSISLSMDNNMWTPYLNANGPDSIWNISYNSNYACEHVESIEDVQKRLSASSVDVGVINGENYIRFVFMVKNTGKFDATIDYEMTLENDSRNLQNAVRVMWGESFKSDDLTQDELPKVEVFAALSNNPRLAGTNLNYNRTPEMGYLEYCAYPVGSDDPTYDMVAYERSLSSTAASSAAQKDGYFETTPFESENLVFKRQTTLQTGDVMYCYVCIWIEGSDFDCVDSARGGYVKLGINFVAS